MRRLSPAQFVMAHTRVRPVPFVAELQLHLADDSLAAWEATQVAVDRGEVPPPFWAFVWSGGQALARHLIDTPSLVADRTVLDVATGSGLVAVAAAVAGARRVVACDIDELAVAACRLNARLNHVELDTRLADVRDVAVTADTLVTVGDVFYDRDIAAVMLPSLARLAATGAEVLVGDPHRAHLPRAGLAPIATYDVEVEADLEDAPVKPTLVARFAPGPPTH